MGISRGVSTIYGYATGHKATTRNATYLRGEFMNPNATGRDRKVTFNEATAKRLGEDIRKRNLAKELVGSRIKLECWDSMEVQKKEVGFTKGFAISIAALKLKFIGQCPCRGNQRKFFLIRMSLIAPLLTRNKLYARVSLCVFCFAC